MQCAFAGMTKFNFDIIDYWLFTILQVKTLPSTCTVSTILRNYLLNRYVILVIGEYYTIFCLELESRQYVYWFSKLWTRFYQYHMIYQYHVQRRIAYHYQFVSRLQTMISYIKIGRIDRTSWIGISCFYWIIIYRHRQIIKIVILRNIQWSGLRRTH